MVCLRNRARGALKDEGSPSLRRRTLAAAALVVALAAVAVPAIAQNGPDPNQGPPKSGPPVPPPDENTVPPSGRPGPPTYAPGSGKLVPANSPIGRKYNPQGSPNIRVCQMTDGSYIIMNTLPLPGQNPYPDDPEDLKYRPC